ncbi:phosphodiesterase [Nocardia sp. NBC_01329]|uniref:phosphodiesterase n=1 Tax=Nocardia sp. NBC_01329 TaxID=2903594 RepID=UPI002E11E278|nr:phosphodiesterase [Nocardia sp. NBC_01329]
MTDQLPANPVSAAVRGAFDVGARLRHARFFHPRGVRLSGRFRAEPEFTRLFGAGDRATIARLSKGVGTPGGVPDILGLAFRVLDRDEKPWDFALATTGQGVAARLSLTVARGWHSARFGSLLPYQWDDSGPLWVLAEPDPGQPPGASLSSLARHVHEHQIGYTVSVAGFGSGRRTVGHLSLRAADPGEHRTDFYDPVLNHPAEVSLLPRAVQWLRESAYDGSRRGRGAEDRETGRVEVLPPR